MQKLAFFLIVIIAACTFKKNDASSNTTAKNTIELTEPKNCIDSFTINYLALKNAFFANSISKVDSAANMVLTSVDNLKKSTATNLNNESLKPVINNIDNLVTGILAKATLKEKLQNFAALTVPIRSILTLQNGYKLYEQNCPMAKDYSTDKNVYWLSAETKIKNPFYPQTMPSCGKITDTIQIK